MCARLSAPLGGIMFHNQPQQHDEFSDEEPSAMQPSASNMDFYDHELDNMFLTPDEQKRSLDIRFTFDFRTFPKAFSTVFDAVDTYCELGYPNRIMFTVYEKKYREQKLVFFSLCCHLRNQPRFFNRPFDDQRMPRTCACPVNVRFRWNDTIGLYERLPDFKLVHDHKLEIDDRCFLQPEIVQFIQQMVMQDPEVRPSLIMRRLYEQTGKKIRHLDTLNALKNIRGDVRLDMRILNQDLELLKQSEPGVFCAVQRSSPLIIFMQTLDMQECQKCYSEVLLISCSRKRKNKYGLFQIHFSTINNYGRVVILALGFTNIKCKQGYLWLFQQYTERTLEEHLELPKVVVTNLDPEVVEAQAVTFTTSMHLVNQNYLLSAVKEVLFPFRRRSDFDFNLVNCKLEELVVETDVLRFQRIETEVLQMIDPLELQVKEEVHRIFNLKTKWAIPYFYKQWTVGLHANERAQHIETFIRMQCKYDQSLLDQLDLVKKIQSVDRSYDTQSKEAFSYYTHPLYKALKEHCTPYAVSMMLHQLIESYKFIAHETTDADTFLVKTDKGLTLTCSRVDEKLSCACAFMSLNRMICSHLFCLANALQIKNIAQLQHVLDFWIDEPNPADPSARNEIPKARQMKKLGSFVDKMADKARMRRARHKGGVVPSRMHKVQVEFYHEENGEKGTVEMYDLMQKTGTKIKAYDRQEEEQRKALIKLQKLGINSIKELDEQMLNEIKVPGLQGDIRRTEGARSSESDQSSLSSDGDDLLEEFKRETQREKEMEREREEARVQKAQVRKQKQKEINKKEKKKQEKKRRKRELSMPQPVKHLTPKSVRTRKDDQSEVSRGGQMEIANEVFQF